MSADDKTTEPDVEDVPDVEPSDGVEIDKIADDAAESEDAEVPAQSDDANPARGWRDHLVPLVILAALLLASGGLTGWLYFKQYRPDVQSDAAAAKSAADAARDGTIAMLSYKPETLNQDFAAAKSHLTGDFLNYYTQFTRDIVTPAATQKAVTTTAQVVGAAAAEMHPNSAVVLVFINQVTTSKDRPDPAMSASSVMVSLIKVHDEWLITKFDPI
jgi:Mce-associated membrane protein